MGFVSMHCLAWRSLLIMCVLFEFFVYKKTMARRMGRNIHMMGEAPVYNEDINVVTKSGFGNPESVCFSLHATRGQS